MNELAIAECCFAENPHPVFLEEKHGGLHQFADADNAGVLRHYMVSMLRRQPGNLKRHVQYIMALVESKEPDKEALFAALCDLFIVLEDKGLPLRRRMLAMAKPFLLEGDFAFLYSNLRTGINGFTILRAGNRSSLTRACNGHCHFINKVDVSSNRAFASLYEEAMSLMDYGDIEEAQNLLEQALRMQPDNAQVAAELVAVYQHRNDTDALAGMAQWFISNNIDLPDCWPLL